jgi:hypothetical protein
MTCVWYMNCLRSSLSILKLDKFLFLFYRVENVMVLEEGQSPLTCLLKVAGTTVHDNWKRLKLFTGFINKYFIEETTALNVSTEPHYRLKTCLLKVAGTTTTPFFFIAAGWNGKVKLYKDICQLQR